MIQLNPTFVVSFPLTCARLCDVLLTEKNRFPVWCCQLRTESMTAQFTLYSDRRFPFFIPCTVFACGHLWLLVCSCILFFQPHTTNIQYYCQAFVWQLTIRCAIVCYPKIICFQEWTASVHNPKHNLFCDNTNNHIWNAFCWFLQHIC